MGIGSRIKATHVHNNFKKYDEHFSPSMGTVNWREVTGALRDIGYDGYLTLESNYYENELMEEYVKHLYDSIVKVEKLFLNEE
ncbi:MAG: TIM barrel protein [Clostridia bacterium]|nr:TIM barrel protein [Clostridia bacterium]